MNEKLIAALDILGGPSNIFNTSNNIPWSFGSISYLTMYWRESGKLDEELDEMDECSTYHRKLTSDHCAGANSVMRAEAMLMRGEEKEAEIFCHKALFEARKYEQTSICLYAELLLAQIAILRQDAESYFSAVKNIQSYTMEKESIYIVRMAELCLSTLDLELGFNENIAQWICNVESISKIMYSHSSFSAMKLFAKFLVTEKRYNEFFGISSRFNT
jgi:LuxR family maltose regulon positive regulatory protein